VSLLAFVQEIYGQNIKKAVCFSAQISAPALKSPLIGVLFLFFYDEK
jgi:hypothetical protein